CLNLRPIIQKDFNLDKSDAGTENATDGSAVETKLIDLFYSSGNKTCYLAQERLGVESIDYYEIYVVQATPTGYEYMTQEPVFGNTCVSEDLFLRSIDPEVLTGAALEKNRQETICTYMTAKLESQLQTEIQKLK
ncbi:MAG: hypothetical protein NTX91_01035, partial [candidate division SR1 bacterium]|nr:hypothetical protein [candidate division SR1 bacterium]